MLERPWQPPSECAIQVRNRSLEFERLCACVFVSLCACVCLRFRVLIVLFGCVWLCLAAFGCDWLCLVVCLFVCLFVCLTVCLSGWLAGWPWLPLSLSVCWFAYLLAWVQAGRGGWARAGRRADGRAGVRVARARAGRRAGRRAFGRAPGLAGVRVRAHDSSMCRHGHSSSQPSSAGSVRYSGSLSADSPAHTSAAGPGIHLKK